MAGQACPCGSGQPYQACCAPLHKGERQAGSCEALMRSRYAAFALGKVDYLLKTLHPDHEDRRAPEAELRAAVRRTASGCRFLGLHVLASAEAPSGREGQVLFVARVFEKGQNRSFAELSDFARDGSGAWGYLRGISAPVDDTARLPFEPSIEAFVAFAGSRG